MQTLVLIYYVVFRNKNLGFLYHLTHCINNYCGPFSTKRHSFLNNKSKCESSLFFAVTFAIQKKIEMQRVR